MLQAGVVKGSINDRQPSNIFFLINRNVNINVKCNINFNINVNFNVNIPFNFTVNDPVNVENQRSG